MDIAINFQKGSGFQLGLFSLEKIRLCADLTMEAFQYYNGGLPRWRPSNI